MRVVVVTQWFPPEKAAIPADIAKALAERGHDVTVLTGFPNYPGGKIYDGWRQRAVLHQRVDGYDVCRVALYPSHDRNVLRRLVNYLSFGLTSTLFGWRLLRSADSVYVYHPPLTAAFGPWLSRRLGGAPYVLHVQDLWPDSVVEAGLLHSRSTGVVERVLRKACGAVYRRASGVLCIAPTMADMLHDRGVPRERLHVVPNWAAESIFHPVPRDEDLARELGFSGHFTVMFAGNIGEVQGLEVAIRAAAGVQDLEDFRLVLVGEGVALKSLRDLAKTLAADNVRFLSPQPLEVMAAVTTAADVQLVTLRDLPFLRGTIPSKLGAVLATGLPVICAVGGDAQRVVQEAEAGWICAPGDAQALAACFREAHASTRQARCDFAHSGRKYYEEHLSLEEGTARIVDELERAAEVPTRSRRQEPRGEGIGR